MHGRGQRVRRRQRVAGVSQLSAALVYAAQPRRRLHYNGHTQRSATGSTRYAASGTKVRARKRLQRAIFRARAAGTRREFEISVVT